MIAIDLHSFFTEAAKLSDLDAYIKKAKEGTGEGNEGNNIVLTEQSPVWLYL